VQLTIEELCDLLTTLNQTSIAELNLKSESFELTVRREVGRSGGIAPAPPSEVADLSPIAFTQPTSAPLGTPAQPSAISTTPPLPPTPPPPDQQLFDIATPMVGTFYRAPAPDEAPFIEVGDRVKPGQTVCIIEAMKLMNELEAEVSGRVVEILVQNGEPVEYGQVLMRVVPD